MGVSRAWWLKFAVLVSIVVFAGLTVYPTVFNIDLSKTKAPLKQKINLGLDLQGGLYLVLGADFNKVYRDIMERQASQLRQGLPEKGFTIKSVVVKKEDKLSDDPRVVVAYEGGSRDKLYETLKKDYWTMRLAGEKPGEMELGLSRDYRTEVREHTLNQSIEVIRNRIDEFGVSEPAISSQGNDRIVVELPGVREVNRAKELIGRTAKLEFRLVNVKSIEQDKLIDLVASAEKDKNIQFKEGDKFSEYVQAINEALKGKIPADSEIAFSRDQVRDDSGKYQTRRAPYLLYTKAEVTGDELDDATVTFDPQDRRPEVVFSLNPRGASLFDKLTADNIGKPIAIVLDNIVHSAPVVQSRIPSGRGTITLGSGNPDDMMKEAKDLAIVLRAGALPAQLDFLEQRVVGPSLGQDSIDRGAKAGILGCLAIFIFITLYYRVSGLVASFSLTLNALFILAVLVGLEATLTLPGIAGIALTIGMAVDSNVLIFERIRDELREGKSVTAAIEAGFSKAFTAIFDANITHGIIAVILMLYGTGPIRGFATTLLIGIFTTLFCAVTVCKLFFDGYIGWKRGNLTHISI